MAKKNSLGRKVLYLVWAMVLVMGLGIPLASAPVMADPDPTLVPSLGLDVLGAPQRFTVVNLPATGKVLDWDFIMGADLTDFEIVEGGQPGDTFVVVDAVSVGELHIYADVDIDGDGKADKRLHATKKWGEISRTDLKVGAFIDDAPGPVKPAPGQDSSAVTWNEELKMFVGGIILNETVFGTFRFEWGSIGQHLEERPADGAIINWWALDPNAPVGSLPALADPKELIALINKMPRAQGVTFGNPVDSPVTFMQTVSGPNGSSSARLLTLVEGRVLIVVVAEYPIDFHGQHKVSPEFARWNFYTKQLEKVPQLRWAGEEIIFEKKFGQAYTGSFVQFFKEAQSPGTFDNALGYSDTVWTFVGRDGVARASFMCEDQGEVDVDAILYNLKVGTNESDLPPDGSVIPPPGISGFPINKHGFVVFYLKLESVTLGNVDGKRLNHNAGPWTPENPFNAATDSVDDTLNVSQDALLRARVTGWFMGDNQSMRPEGYIDANGNGQPDPTEVKLPAGRWVLPDDWAALAGPNWKDLRPRWDIMDSPNDTVVSVKDTNADKAEELGAYLKGSTLVANPPVIGPFNSADTYDPIVRPWVFADPTLPDGRKTLVPNGELDWYDAPMPPAKVMFKILNKDTKNPGFFKEADKGDIYYRDATVYTNPFYKVEIPASPFIPPFVNNGGYDWDSWGWTALQGPYDFWHIFNYLPNNEVPAEDNQHPTQVEVYSDNHGEAMVYLNGDANLKLPADFETAPGTVMGSTVVKATADYPYLRKHQSVDSNTIKKTWTWGKEIAVRVRQVDADPLRKMILIYVTDRDGFPVIGEQVDWAFDSGVGLIDKVLTSTGWKTVGPGVRNITTFSVTPGTKEAAEYNKPAAAPTSGFLKGGVIQDEAKFYPDIQHGVAGIVVYRSEPSPVDIRVALYEREGIIIKDVYLNFAYISPTDPTVNLTAGKWNEVLFQAAPMSVSQALASIPADVTVTVWSADGKGYNSKAPAWANDLSQFIDNQTYYLWVSKDTVWTYGN